MSRSLCCVLFLMLLIAACGRDAEPAVSLQPAAKNLIPLPRPDDNFAIARTSTVDGRTVKSVASALVQWQWAADVADGTELLRISALSTELWWRSETGLAVWNGVGWQVVEGVGPIHAPTSGDRGLLRATVSTEPLSGSGETPDGCMLLRISHLSEGSADPLSLQRTEERTLCPQRGEVAVYLRSRGPLGEVSERWVRR